MLTRLQTVFDTVAEGIVLQDESGAIIEANPAASRLLGLTIDQLLGRTSVDPQWRALRADGTDFPWEDQPAMRTLRTGEPQSGVIMGVHRPDGSLNWISINSAEVAQAGRRTGVVSTLTDVTAQRNAQAELVPATEALKQLREIQSLFIEGAPTERACQTLLGLFLEATGSSYGFIAELWPEGGSASFLAHAVLSSDCPEETQPLNDTGTGLGLGPLSPGAFFETAAEAGAPRFANPATPEDLARSHLPNAPAIQNVVAIPIIVGGHVIGLVGLANRTGHYDEGVVSRCGLTAATCGQILSAIRLERERWQAQEDLRASEERYDLVLDATGIGRWDWNPTTDFAVFDRQWCHLVGYDLHEVEPSGRGFFAMAHADDHARISEALNAHLRGNTPHYRVEFRMRHRSGRTVWILALGRLIEHDAEGRPERMIGIHIDITRQKEVQAELERSRDLSDRANRAKSEFLATMSHEIRTPMNGVIGVAHILLDTPLSVEQREYAETIKHSGELLLTLIDDILDFSKIEADRLELESVPFDPRQVIAETSDVIAPRAEEKGLELLVDWQCTPYTELTGDPKRLRQILLNLMSNAVKFTAEGAITVAIDLANAETLRFRVIDNGVGIPADKHQVIFERFAQADGSTTRRFGGTGLGLAISLRLVQAMGGSIGVESQLGEGSTFWFTLPIRAGALEVSSNELDGQRILVASPTSILLDATRRLLERRGAEVATAKGSIAAREALRDAVQRGVPFDLLIVDDTPAADAAAFVDELSRAWAGTLPHLVVATTARRHGHLQRQLHTTTRLLRKPMGRLPALLAAAQPSQNPSEPTTDPLPASALEPVRLPVKPLATVAAPTLSDRRVLLAEDNDINRLVAVTILQKLGCDVVLAVDGREAVERVAAERFACVFMDCDMPELDGYEATAAIRAMELAEDLPPIPIIALTANALRGDRERCLAAGMNDYLSKPVTPNEMARAVERWASRLAASVT